MFTINQNLIDDFADKINEKEKKSNKVTSLSSSSTDTQYPSAKAVYDNISSATTAINNRITNLHEGNINITGTPYTQLGGATATSLATLLHNIDNNFGDILFCAYNVRGTADAFTISGTGGFGNLTSNHPFILLAYNNVADSNAGATLTINNTMNPVTIVNNRMGGSASCAWKKGEWGIFFIDNGSAQLLGSFSDTEYYQGMEFVTSTNTQTSDTSLTGVTHKLNNLKDGTIFFYQLPNLRFTSQSSAGFTLTLRNNISLSGALKENNVNQSLSQLSPNDILILQYSYSANSPAYNIIGKIQANTFTEKKDTALQLLCNAILPYRIFTVHTVKKEDKKTTYLLTYDGTPYATNEILYVYVPAYGVTTDKKPILSWGNTNMPIDRNIYPINSSTALYEHDLNGYYLKIQFRDNRWVLLEKTNNIVEATTEHAGLLSVLDKTKLNNLHTVATSGSYNDLSNKPTIPTATSDLTNDSNFLTSHQSLDSKTVTVEEQSQAETGFTKTYIIKQGGVQVGNKINIPKDFLVKSASVKTVSTANNPVQGYVTGDKYLDFVVNSKDNTATDEHLYVLVSELVDTEIDWANVQNKPTFFDGNYNSLTNKPNIPNASSDLSDGSDLVKKSSTTGLLKNDGSVMSSGTGSSNWAVGNHTHTSLQKTTITSGNLDDYTDTGWYTYSTTNSSSITNTPENVGSVMEVFDDYGDGKYIVQKVYTLPSDNNSIIYYRQKYNTSWGDWKQIINTDDASTTAPVANRVASSATTGSSTKYARADHSHTLTQFKCNGTAGSNGYIKVFQIKINGTYQDSPISFSLMQRGTKQSAEVNIRFANENNNDPTLDSFTFNGNNIGNNGEYYLYKESASTWSFIVKKWDTHDVINIYNMSTTNGSVAITSLNTQISELPSGCIPASMVKNDLFFKTKNGSTSNYINLFEIRPTNNYQSKPITFEIIRNTKPTPVYVSFRLTNVTLASNTYAPQTIWSWGTSDTPVYFRKEADNVFNVIVYHTENEEISVCNMNNPNPSVKITPLGTVYGTNAPVTSGDHQVWKDTYTVGGTTFGTGTNNVIRGNDSRLSDTRNPKSTKISAGSDLNTYTTTGFYYNNANTDCATITPLPQPNKAFFLQVEDWGTSNYTKQTITHYDPVKTYERIRNSGTWTGWYELQHNDGTGGENLLRTEPNNEGNSGIAYTIADETFHNDKVYYRNETSQDTTKYSGWTWPIPKNEFDYGDIFTLSFYAKGTNGAEIRTYFAGASGYISNRRISSNSDVDADKTIGSYGDGATRFHLTSDWKRYYVTYQLNSTATTPTQNKSIHIRTFGASTDIEFYISNVKLERGYYATDYDRHTRDNEPLYFPTEISLPTTTTSANRRKFIHPPYKFKNIPNWTVEGEIKVTGNSARFELHKTDDTNLKNFIAVGKNGSGNLAYWWGTSSSAESSKTYDASHIAVDTWYPFRISRMGNNVLFMFNNTDKYEVTTTYFNTFEYIEPSIFGYGTNGVSVRNLKITPLEPVHPLSPSSSVCTNAQGIITTEAKNYHNHSDTQLNWNGGAMVNSASPLDMCLNEELSPNRLAYLDGNNIDVDYSTDGGSTWTSYGASATEKSKLVTTTQTFISGKGATASSNNQLRITIHSGLTSGSISQIYLATRKLMIYYSTGGGSGNKVKIQTNTYGSPDTWTDVKEYNIGGYSGWNSFPLNITFGGFANQTNTTRIKSIRLIFTITSNHNFNVQKIRLYGENCYVAQSDYAKTGHIYTVDILKNVTFPAKIIKEGGTSSQYLMANGDVQNKITSWSNTPSDSNVASEKLVKDSLDLKSDNTHTHIIDPNKLFDFYNADNWKTLEGGSPTITTNTIQANAVSGYILKKEFFESKHYTLTFDFNTSRYRTGIYLFGDENLNKKFGITTDITKTVVEQYDAEGIATTLYTATKDYFTGSSHNVKVIRNGDIATIYINEELVYTFTDIGSCTNIVGLWKWGSGSASMSDFLISDFLMVGGLGESILYLIDNTLGHMINNWENYE